MISFLKKYRLRIFAVVLLTAAGFLTVLLHPACLFRQAFHIPCPGCGMTRAFRSLLAGDFYGAWVYNPLIFSAGFLYWLILSGGRPFGKHRRLNAVFLALLLLSVAVFYAVRLRMWNLGQLPFL